MPSFLIDYHNVHGILSLTHPTPRRRGLFSQDVVDWVVDQLCSALQKWRQDECPSVLDWDVRFYSGWFEGEQDTDHAGMVRSALMKQRRLLAGRVRFRYQLATSLVDLPGELLQHTLRARPLPRLAWKPAPAGCSSPAACHVERIDRCFREGVCGHGGCTVALSTVGRQLEQKIVDSHMICDMLSLAEDRDVVLVSNDTDFVPAMLLSAGRWPGRVRWMRIPESTHAWLPGPYHEDALRRRDMVFCELPVGG